MPEPHAEMGRAVDVPFARPDIDDDDVAAVVGVLRSGWLTTGQQCVALEDALAGRLGVRHAVAVSSCTAALEIAYASLGLPSGARVGVPVWTFASTALSFVHHGGVPVLLDVERDSLNVDPTAVEAALATGLDALVVVHFGGVPVSADVLAAAEASGVPVIEDAAHALGATDERGPIAGRGTHAACFSFYATKNLTSVEGGALTTTSDETADFARSFRLHGLSRDAWARYLPGASSDYDLVHPGIKANLPDALGALALSQLKRFDAMQQQRRRLVDRYRDQLGSRRDLTFVPAEAHTGSADHLMVVLLPAAVERASVQGLLSERGIATSVHFRPLHTFRWFRENAEVGPAGTAVADQVAGRALSLPLYSTMTLREVDLVCEALLDVLPRT
jgi:dTDP-4-amino-4,6-dideoxygalactose transaminase